MRSQVCHSFTNSMTCSGIHEKARWNTGAAAGLALAMDLAAGEPPEILHPVCWMGKAVALAEGAARRATTAGGGGPRAMKFAGAVTAVALPAGVYLGTRAALKLLPGRWRGFSEAVLLYTALAAHSLGRTARGVDAGLAQGVEQGRDAVSHLVGRDTASLDEDGIARAAVESVAENANDGVVAPLLYGFIGGAPLALAYKMVNTLDSMVGYRDERYRDFGWAAARLDDLAGYIPARLTALAAVAVSPALGADPRRAVNVWLSESGGHASPNAGVCEGAFAGALGVQLGGANSYAGTVEHRATLGTGLRPAGRGDIRRAVGLMYGAVAVAAASGTAISWVLSRFTGGRHRRRSS